MHLNIYDTEELIPLKRNQKLTPDKIYLIGSESVTNSLYFRSARDIEKAHQLIIHRLSGILTVVDYLFTPKGWLLLVKFKSKSEIISFYKRMRGFCKDKVLKYDVGRIISEIIRTTISTLVSFINSGSKRKGALVYRVFKRFSISTLKGVKLLMSKMKKREIILSNQNKRFSPNLKRWNKSVLPGIGMSFLSSDTRFEKILSSEKNSLNSVLLNIGFQLKVCNLNVLFKNGFIDKCLIINDKMLR